MLEANEADKATINTLSTIDDNQANIVNRYDEIDLSNLKLQETEEGYLEGFAIATRVGVFSYMRKDGTIQKEYRPPEEVFDQASLDSFKMKPITLHHPQNEFVNAKNAKEYTVGFTGQEIKTDNNYMAPFLTITDEDAINKVQNGLRSLSCGHTVILEKAEGVYNGERYDYIQRNIRGNHLAIVYSGRAGEQARLRLDSQGAICVNNNNQIIKEDVFMKKLKLDGNDFEVANEVIEKFDSLQEDNKKLNVDLATLQTKLDTLQGQYDALQDKNNSIKAELEKRSKQDNAIDIGELVKSRIGLEKKCSRFLKADEDVSKLSDQELKIKVLNQCSKEFKADGKSQEYINARFDAILDLKDEINLAANLHTGSFKLDSTIEKSYGTSNQELQKKLLNKSINSGV